MLDTKDMKLIIKYACERAVAMEIYGEYGQTTILLFLFPNTTTPQTSDLWSFLPQPYLMKHKKR